MQTTLTDNLQSEQLLLLDCVNQNDLNSISRGCQANDQDANKGFRVTAAIWLILLTSQNETLNLCGFKVGTVSPNIKTT